MDQILDIQLILDDGKLTALDHTIYPANATSVLHQYVNVEFIVYNDDNAPSKVVYSNPGTRETTFTLDNDGIYHYYKLGVPVVEYFYGKALEPLVGEIFYDGIRRTLMQIMSVPEASDADSIVRASKPIDYLDAYNAVLLNISQYSEANESYFFPKKEVFNVCKLRKCLVYLQRKMLLGNCSFDDCSGTKGLRDQRDFLLSAIYVVDYLKDTNNLEEAQRIIDNLSTCGFPCEDNEFTFSDCGCGHTV